MTRAVAAGMPKLRIEEAAARRQARLDRGEDVVVGVNRYRTDAGDMPALLDVDNHAVREAQIARIAAVRAARDEETCRAALERLTAGARGDDNLLGLAIEAMRVQRDGGRGLGRDGDGLHPPPGDRAHGLRRLRLLPMRGTTPSRASAARPRASPRRRGAGRASWWSSSARTGTTAAPR